MELIRISERKLKIMLTPTDMCHFELDAEALEGDSEQMHRAFRTLLAEIRRRTDFDADDRHISVQYFPSRGGGCEMFISNLQESTEKALQPIEKPTPQSRALKRQSGAGYRRECAYRFGKLEHLLSVCRRLVQIGFACESGAWRDEKGDYFLFLTLLSSSPFSTPAELDFIPEYGTIENAALLRLYIKEHATGICPSGAVPQLAKLL